MYACLGVTCHLHFWRCGKTGMERTPSKTLCQKFTYVSENSVNFWHRLIYILVVINLKHPVFFTTTRRVYQVQTFLEIDTNAINKFVSAFTVSYPHLCIYTPRQVILVLLSSSKTDHPISHLHSSCREPVTASKHSSPPGSWFCSVPLMTVTPDVSRRRCFGSWWWWWWGGTLLRHHALLKWCTY